MIEKICVGCKERVMTYKKYPWYEKMKYNILHQRYTSDTSDKAAKIRKLICLFGAYSVNACFKWRNTPEGDDFWREVAIQEPSFNQLKGRRKFKKMDVSKLNAFWDT